MIKILVTGYKNPDLDGTACSFAYAEFLQKNGKNVVAAVFGAPSRETQFVFKKFNILPIKNAEKIIDTATAIILVDASDLRGISDKIDPSKVIEIIDHRKVHEAHKFLSAKAQIELVGSAATLIAEKFYKTNTPISKESSALLFSAIISNTLNFKANVTTERDHKMADWLKTKFNLPENYIHELFTDKSNFKELFKWTFIDDLATFQFGDSSLGIAQLEIIGVDDFVHKNLEKIKTTLSRIKQQKSLDLVFLTCIDLEKAFNMLIVIDEKTQEIMEKTLKVKFKNGIAKRRGILMRKEIVPLIKDVLEMKKILRPYFVIIRGPLGCGKSTIAGKISKLLTAEYVAVDRVLDEHHLIEDKEDGYISQRSFIKANELIASKAKKKLQSGIPVVFDGNFYWKSQIDDLIQRLDFPHLVFTLKAPLKVCIERDRLRGKTHGKDAARVVYKKATEFDYGLVIDVTKPIEEAVKEIHSKLKKYL